MVLSIINQLNCHPWFTLDARAEVASEIERVLLVRTEAVLQPQRVDLVDLHLFRVVESSLLIGVVESQPETRHVQGIALLVVLKSQRQPLCQRICRFHRGRRPPALFDHFGATHVGLCRGRRQAHWVDLGPHLELLAEHDHGDVVVQRDVVKLRVDVNLLGAVRSEMRSELNLKLRDVALAESRNLETISMRTRPCRACPPWRS